MLCECTNVPGAMSAAAKPIVTLYLRMGSPCLMARAAILWPEGTWLRQGSPSPSLAPISTFERAITTLSALCRRITGPAAGFSRISIIDASFSLALDAGGLNHLRPLRDLVLDECGVRLGRVADRVRALRGQPLAQVRGIESPHDLAMQPLDDGARGLRRSGHTVPVSHFISRNPAFRHRRDIRHRGRALGPSHRERAQPAAAHVLDHCRQIAEHQRSLAGEQFDRRRTATLVWYVHPFDAGHVLEQLPGEVDRGAGTRGCEIDLARPPLGKRDQLQHVPRRK